MVSPTDGPDRGRSRPTDRLRVVTVWLAVIGQILGGYLPLALGSPASIGQRSAQLRTPTVPAGYAFSIWGLLFLWAIVFAVWQSLPAQQTSPRLRRTGWWVAGLCGSNTLWELYVPWFSLDWISLVLIWTGLGCALALVWVLEHTAEPLPRMDRWLLRAPFYAYAGWLSAAAFVNVAATLRMVGPTWPDPRSSGVAAAILLVAAALGSTVAFLTRAWAYAVPVMWALVAVVVANLTRTQNVTVALVAVVGALGVLSSVWLGWRRRRKLDSAQHSG